MEARRRKRKTKIWSVFSASSSSSSSSSLSESGIRRTHANFAFRKKTKKEREKGGDEEVFPLRSRTLRAIFVDNREGENASSSSSSLDVVTSRNRRNIAARMLRKQKKEIQKRE